MSTRPLPALRLTPDGRRRVDYRAVIALALPLFLSFGVQALMNITDTWFAGRLATVALGALNASHFSAWTFFMFFGGLGLSVQTLAAQAYGGGRYARVSRATWAGIWASVAVAPFFVGIALSGDTLFGWFGLPAGVHDAAVEYWFPRMIGGAAVVGHIALSGFFNGTGRTGTVFVVGLVGAVLNAILDEVLMFRMEMGIAGAGWASSIATTVMLAIMLGLFLRRRFRREYKSALLWRPNRKAIAAMLVLGVPLGVHITLDVGSFAAFNLMIGSLGEVEGAATQICMQVFSLAFLPAIGISFAGATLVGQAIGAGDRDWAFKVGTGTVKLAVVYMGGLGVLFALGGERLAALFVNADSPDASAVIALTATLLAIAAIYQVFDGLNLSASGCLRGAGDVNVPAMLMLATSWGLFVPLAHTLIFEPGAGWIAGAPGLGLGAVGGWIAALVHITLLGSVLFWRWRSGGWRKRRVSA